MKVKHDSRGIRLLPCVCGHQVNEHDVRGDDGRYSRWSQDRVVIGACKCCECREFEGDKAA